MEERSSAILAMFVVAIALFGYGLLTTGDDAMTECQKQNSHDVCFQSLNR